MPDKIVNVGKPVCKKVLPTVYSDSLSYYEELDGFIEKLNEVIDYCNGLTDEILAEAKAYTDNAIHDTFAEVDRRLQELNDLIEQTIRDFNQLVDETVETFNGIVDDLQNQYSRFTKYVNAQLDQTNRRIDETNSRLDASIIALSSEIDLKIQIAIQELIEELTNNLPELTEVWNILEGVKMTVQNMFNYLCYLHVVDGINISTLVSRQLTVSHIAGLQRTVRDCVMYGNTILV